MFSVCRGRSHCTHNPDMVKWLHASPLPLNIIMLILLAITAFRPLIPCRRARSCPALLRVCCASGASGLAWHAHCMGIMAAMQTRTLHPTPATTSQGMGAGGIKMGSIGKKEPTPAVNKIYLAVMHYLTWLVVLPESTLGKHQSCS